MTTTTTHPKLRQAMLQHLIDAEQDLRDA